MIDGAPWIRNQIEFHGLTDQIVLDFYHLQENVHKARKRVFGEESEEGKAWMGRLMHTFKHSGYEAAWEMLLESRSGLRTPQKRKALRELVQYVSERREMIRYPQFRQRGWQIGSGPTESVCKTTPVRVKGRAAVGIRGTPKP